MQVREALDDGDLATVKSFLGRPYTLCLDRSVSNGDQDLIPRQCFLNQPPRNGLYRVKLNNVYISIELTQDGLLCPTGIPNDTVVRLTFL